MTSQVTSSWYGTQPCQSPVVWWWMIYWEVILVLWVIRHLVRLQLLLWWYLQQQRVRVRVMTGFWDLGRVRIKIRIRVRVSVGVMFNVSVCHGSNCHRSKCCTLVLWIRMLWISKTNAQLGCSEHANNLLFMFRKDAQNKPMFYNRSGYGAWPSHGPVAWWWFIEM